jgi:hypothetical protein
LAKSSSLKLPSKSRCGGSTKGSIHVIGVAWTPESPLPYEKNGIDFATVPSVTSCNQNPWTPSLRTIAFVPMSEIDAEVGFNGTNGDAPAWLMRKVPPAFVLAANPANSLREVNASPEDRIWSDQLAMATGELMLTPTSIKSRLTVAPRWLLILVITIFGMEVVLAEDGIGRANASNVMHTPMMRIDFKSARLIQQGG